MRKSVFALLAAILALAFCSVSLADAPDDGWDRCSEEWGEEHWENGEWDGALRGYVLCNTLTLRSEPSDSAPAICTLDYGAKLYVGFPAEDNDEWYDATYMADVHALRIISDAGQRLLHELYLRMRSRRVALERVAAVMYFFQSNLTVVSAACNRNRRHIFTLRIFFEILECVSNETL